MDPGGGQNRLLRPFGRLLGAKSAPGGLPGRSGTGSGVLWGPSWGALGGPWRHLGPLLAPLGPSWAPSGALLGSILASRGLLFGTFLFLFEAP